MLKKVVLGIMAASVVATFIAPAHAKCGPQLTINFKADQDDTVNTHGIIGNDTYESSETYTGLRSEYGPTRRDGDSFGINFGISIPLGVDYCEEQEFARKQQSEAQARSTELRNVETALKLCKQYGPDHPLLKGKCK